MDPYRLAYELEMAHYRVSKAKQRVDEAQRNLDAAEDEWHQECRELDRLRQATTTPKAGERAGG